MSPWCEPLRPSRFVGVRPIPGGALSELARSDITPAANVGKYRAKWRDPGLLRSGVLLEKGLLGLLGSPLYLGTFGLHFACKFTLLTII